MKIYRTGSTVVFINRKESVHLKTGCLRLSSPSRKNTNEGKWTEIHRPTGNYQRYKYMLNGKGRREKEA
jgi:hypothetical protein